MNQSGQLFFFYPRTFIQYSLWQGEREREVHICHIWTKQEYWERRKANESQILTMDILSSPKTDLSDSHKKERIWREVELKKNEQHCSGLHFLAQLAQPPSGNLATASCLTLKTNAFIFLHASTLPSFISNIFFHYLTISFLLHFSIAISTLPFFKIGFKYLYQPVYIFFLSDTYIDLKNTVKHYPPQNIFLHPSTTQHCPPAELRLVQMTLVMTPNDLKTTLLHWRGTTSLVKLEHHT